uniref:Uncharacterized protein n=1 Tax=Arundo donax TaxID=35708 RepID=A0A0A8ZA59_ARUDO
MKTIGTRIARCTLPLSGHRSHRNVHFYRHVAQPLRRKKQRRRSQSLTGPGARMAPTLPVWSRRHHRRAAQRAGGRLAAADPRIDARGVERVRAAAQLRHHLVAPFRFQPRQADRAHGRALVVLCVRRPGNPPPPVPRTRERPLPDSWRAGRAQRRLQDALHGGRVHVLPAPRQSGQPHLALARRDAEAVEEDPGDEA